MRGPLAGSESLSRTGETIDLDSRAIRAGLVRVLTDVSRPSAAIYGMMTFMEYIAKSRKMTLPDAHTMLAMAGVGLDSPNEEETERLLNRDKKHRPAGGKAHKTIVPLDSQPVSKARK